VHTEHDPEHPALAGVRDHLELAKARLSLMVLLTTLVGYLLTGLGPQGLKLMWVLLGTGLSAAGANALNQWLEEVPDSLMRRTRGRPLPARRMSRGHALACGLGCAAAGVVILGVLAEPLAGSLALVNILLYTLVYTPLKRRTSFCTLAGAVCGALPPMIGWAGATGRLGVGAWLLAAILFTWQIPHFFALAWLYRHDYARAGFRMLPVVDQHGQVTFSALLLFSLALLPIGLVVTMAGIAGPVFAAGSLVLGLGWTWLGLGLYQERSDLRARRVFLASLAYLPALLLLMLVDRNPLFLA
jgi:protoheme IX farnesyltransferase